MSYRQANLSVLLAAHPRLEGKDWDLRCGAGQLQAIPTPSGKPTAVWRGATLHSRYDPLREAERLITQELKPGISLAIFYGFGLGYLVEAFRRRFPAAGLAVIEPDLDLFAAALAVRDLRGLLADPGIHWCLEEEPEAIVMRLERLPLAEAQVIRLRSVYAGHREYYERLDGLFSAFLHRREVNLNTLNRFGKLWVRNLLKNLEPFLLCPGVTRLAGLFRGLPALVLAAGPSLDLALPHLAALRQRLLLVAVDTSLQLCLRQNVEPDFLITVDPQYWNSRYLDWARPRSTVLISESSCCPRIFHLLDPFKVRTFFVSSFFPLGQFLESIVGEKGSIGAGGSVATTAWDAARLLGAGPIYMAGLDLGFPQKRTHCKGAFFEESMHVWSGRCSPAEGMSYRYLHEAVPFPIASNSSRPTYTDRRMMIYKWWFENQLKISGPPTYSLSEQGVRIGGMPFLPLEQVLDLPSRRAEIETIMAAVLACPASGVDRREAWRKVHPALRELKLELERLKEAADQGLELCRRLAAAAQPEGRSARAVLEELDRVDKRILELSSRKVAGFLLQGLIDGILGSPAGGGNLRDAVAASRAVYAQLRQSAQYHLELLERTVGWDDFSKVGPASADPYR